MSINLTTSSEVSALPVLRAIAYPETRICPCEPEGVVMIRNASLDFDGETPHERYERGANEGFECPSCKEYELFPPEGLTLRDIARFFPGWGRTRNAGHGEAA